MKKIISSVILVMAILLGGTSFAEVQPLFNYQARLVNSEGTPYEGNHAITLSIYDVASGGVALRGAVYNCNIENGYFNIQFGAEPGMDISTLAYDTQYYLGIKVEGQSEMTPREKLGSVAYAMRAQTAVQAESTTVAAMAQTVADNSISESKIQYNAVTRDHIGVEEIIGANLVPGTIMSDRIGDAQITAAKVANGAIDTQAKAPFAARVAVNGAFRNNAVVISGVNTTNDQGRATISFPHTFSQIPNVVCSPGRGDESFFIIMVTNITTSSFSVIGGWPGSGVGAATYFYWTAVGY